MKISAKALVIAFAAVLTGSIAQANTVLFSWGGTDSGQVTFGIGNDNSNGTCLTGGCTLVVDLYDTGAKVAANADFLAGLSFDIQQGTTNGIGGTTPTLSMISANAMDGFFGTPQPSSSNICTAGGTGSIESCASTMTGGWESLYSSTGFTGLTGNWAIGTTGFQKLGSAFNGGDTGSFNYSLVPTTGSSVTNKEPYVTYQAEFVYTGLTSSAIFITQVQALYGTGPDTTPYGNLISGEAPEPHTVAMIAGAMLLMLLKRRRRA